MNWKECKIIAEELNTVLVGGKIQKIKEGENGEIVLSIYSSGQSYNLLISLLFPYTRLHLTNKAFKTIHPRNFCMYLRKHVIGQIIKNINSFDGERIIEIEMNRSKLVAELFNRGGNVYVLSEKNEVLYSLVQTDIKEYSFEISEEKTEVDEPKFDDDKLYNQVLDDKFNELIETKRFERLKKRVVKLFNNEKKRLKRKSKAILNDKSNIEKAKDFLTYGNLLKTYFYDLKKGFTEYKCFDYEKNQDVVIPLDIKKTPEENMNAYFKKAKKYKNTEKYISENIERVNKQTENINKHYDEIMNTSNYNELLVIINQLSKNKYLRKIIGNLKINKTNNKAQKSEPFRYYLNENGNKIYIGRDDADNDKLTFTFGKGRDLWLHVKDYPGSHVLVQLQNEKDNIDDKLLKDAALLAIHFSKAKGNDSDVTFTRRKYVSKLKGMPKGMVNLSKHNTIFIKYDQSRIRDIFEIN